jgi:hypothetical protein
MSLTSRAPQMSKHKTTHYINLQRGLVPEDKAVRVENYARKIVYGVGLIAHSCGVPQPRVFEQTHVRIIENGGRSVSLAQVHPIPEVQTQYIFAELFDSTALKIVL